MKYLLCYYIEKLHRYCFDNVYRQEKKSTIQDYFCLRLLDFYFWLIPDYRQYLRKWHEDKKTIYSRYSPY
jgi:hypothetical protein